MQMLVIDPQFGASGDMLVSSLLSLGANQDTVLTAIRSVSTPTIETVTRNGIEALSIRMNTKCTPRTFDDVLKIVNDIQTSDAAKKLAIRVFKRIETAESTVHHTSHPHFHEVGSDDAIADIVGACTAFLSLAVDSVCVLPVTIGYGTLHCSHGTMSIPAPATAEILKNSRLSTIIGSFEGELCTPTGAALLAEFAEQFPGTMQSGIISSIGRGAGTHDFPDHPNILTSYIITTERTSDDTVDVLETNVDDISGEILGYTLTRMMELGARDASAIPIIMKKGRCGYLIRVICDPDKTKKIAERLAIETGSLGIRCIPMVHRFTADRTSSTTSIEIDGKPYTASVKQASIGNYVYSRKAEFEHCQYIAEDTDRPVREIKRIIETNSWK